MIFENSLPKANYGQNIRDSPNGSLTADSRSLQTATLNTQISELGCFPMIWMRYFRKNNDHRPMNWDPVHGCRILPKCHLLSMISQWLILTLKHDRLQVIHALHLSMQSMILQLPCISYEMILWSREIFFFMCDTIMYVYTWSWSTLIWNLHSSESLWGLKFILGRLECEKHKLLQ